MPRALWRGLNSRFIIYSRVREMKESHEHPTEYMIHPSAHVRAILHNSDNGNGFLRMRARNQPTRGPCRRKSDYGRVRPSLIRVRKSYLQPIDAYAIFGAMNTEGVLLDDYFRQYGLIAIFTALAVAVPTGMLIASWVLSLFRIRPRKPDPIKMSIYECGFETQSGTWRRFNFRFYSFALIFIVFDVEVVFLFPWAASFGILSRQFGAFVLAEMAIFIAILVVGWLYAWRKGALQWA